jgi:hypothetical protein
LNAWQVKQESLSGVVPRAVPSGRIARACGANDSGNDLHCCLRFAGIDLLFPIVFRAPLQIFFCGFVHAEIVNVPMVAGVEMHYHVSHQITPVFQQLSVNQR